MFSHDSPVCSRTPSAFLLRRARGEAPSAKRGCDPPVSSLYYDIRFLPSLTVNDRFAIS